MTPQERQLVTELFDRLATLENAPRDPDAERAITEGLGHAPHAVYALVQTTLVQDEALKRAHARIEELEGQTAGEPPQGGGFLDNMRGALFGRDEPRRGSVPTVRQGGLGSSGAWSAGGPPPSGPSGYGSQDYGSQGPQGYGSQGYGSQGYGPGGMAPSGAGMGGGSFLGTAAASAAGVIGGAMLLNSVRSMFGHGSGSASAFGAGGSTPSGSGSAANSDLARQAGIDDIGKNDSASASGRDQDRAGLFGSGNSSNDDDNDSSDDSDLAGDFDGGDDSDLA